MNSPDDQSRHAAARLEARVRPLRRTDVETVHDIHAICLTQSLMSHYSLRQIQAVMQGRTPMTYWNTSETGEQFRLVEVSETIAGYASWREDALMSIFVAPVAQGHGLGTMLFRACAREAQTSGQPISQLRATLNATSFFRTLGFHPVEQGFEEINGERIPHMLMRRPVDRTEP